MCCVAGIRYRLALPHWMQQIAQMSGCGGKAANCFKQRHLRSKCGIGTAKVYYLRYSTGSIEACVWGLWCARVAR